MVKFRCSADDFHNMSIKHVVTISDNGSSIVGIEKYL